MTNFAGQWFYSHARPMSLIYVTIDIGNKENAFSCHGWGKLVKRKTCCRTMKLKKVLMDGQEDMHVSELIRTMGYLFDLRLRRSCE